MFIIMDGSYSLIVPDEQVDHSAVDIGDRSDDSVGTLSNPEDGIRKNSFLIDLPPSNIIRFGVVRTNLGTSRSHRSVFP